MRALILAAALLALPAWADGRLEAYISGGIGEEDRAVLTASRDYYNLRLAFAVRGSGEYLSAVRAACGSGRRGPSSMSCIG